MALAKEVYQALEDIVGPEYISEEPLILDSYARQHDAELIRPEQSVFMTRPEAALLPGSTEEVQAIVKACNRYRIKYKAYSTGWGVIGSPFGEGVIQLDMKRMDKILEIDEKNMFAVVEPCVIGATLQAEAMKVGLNTHMIGAGAGCSPLAAATSYYGGGPDSIFMGTSPENMLAVEWVLPTGDILRTGSLVSRDGWFCGEGPGPSLRGIMRGAQGALGGMGVYTKCALKLYPWPGPSVLPVEGTVPVYKTSLPKTFRSYTLAFPTWQAYAECHYKIYDAEIGYIAHRQFNVWGSDLMAGMLKIISDPTKQLDDLEELLKTPEVQKLTEEMRICFQFVLVGMTPRHIEYQEKVLDGILAETGGHKVAALSDPEMEKYTLMYFIRMAYKNLNFSFAGGNQGGWCQPGTPDFLASSYAPKVAPETKRKYIEAGLCVDDGGDALMGPISGAGGGGNCYLEMFLHYDPADKESVKAAMAHQEDETRTALEHGWFAGLEQLYYQDRRPKKDRQESMAKGLARGVKGPTWHWQRKIKQILDPNNTGEWNSYPYLDEPPK